MLLTFVPGFSHPVLQVDASDKQGERLVLEMQLAVLRVRPLRPGEAHFFQPLAQDPQSGSVPKENLQAVASFATCRIVRVRSFYRGRGPR